MSSFRICIVLGALTWALAAASRSAGDGVYTKAQATRGRTVFNDECAKCHGDNLAGGESAPGLVGDDFTRWNGKTANDLFEITRKTMPADDPGHLSRRQYADIVAYMLSANEFKAGDTELESTPEALQAIRIEIKK